ncbi:MAG: hypothetical protein A2176_13125 [Spirochaetes bacterium RBG_13_51_14]|nr:MAG: hypothetical protein A2176_13125 [Spirochaetes bacterium RBG_13_51_14]
MKKVSISEIQNALNPEIVRSFQIIYIGIMAGATFFLCVILFMYLTGSPGEEISMHSLETVNLLTLMHLISFAAGMVVSKYLYNRSLSEPAVESAINDMKADAVSNIAGHYISIIRTAKIIRLALIEGPAFFGLVTCFLAVNNKIIYQYGYYWINIFSYIVFIYIVIKDFPTREKLLEIFKNKLKYLIE